MITEIINVFKPQKEITANVHQIVQGNLIIVDRFLLYLQENKSDIVKDFILKLERKYLSYATSAIVEFNPEIFKEDINKLELLKNHSTLIKSIAHLILTSLEINGDYRWEIEEMTTPQVNVNRAWLMTRILLSELLTEMMERDEAIQFLKDYFFYYVREYRKVGHQEDLRTVFKNDTEDGKKNENTKCVSVLVDEGMYVSRVDRCMAHEALKDYLDSEIKHTVCCSADYELVQKTNENFVLTRTSTLMNGSCCDFCCHDTRIVDDIQHPSKEFYENLRQSEK